VFLRRPDFEHEARRTHRIAFLQALASESKLDVTAWILDRPSRVRRPLHTREGQGEEQRVLGIPSEVHLRWVHPWSFDPEFVSAGLALKFLSGPMAARPQATVGFGLVQEGYLAAALGRVLGVPSIIAAGTPVERWGRRARRIVSWGSLVLAGSDAVADSLARYGVRAQVSPAPSEQARWSELGRSTSASLVQGAVSSTSRS
jgi:hypothetical protein